MQDWIEEGSTQRLVRKEQLIAALSHQCPAHHPDCKPCSGLAATLRWIGFLSIDSVLEANEAVRVGLVDVGRSPPQPPLDGAALALHLACPRARLA